MTTKRVLCILGGFAVCTAGNAQNTFPNSGNVGIGTTSPDARLTLSSATGEQIKTLLPSGVAGTVIVHYNGDAFLIMRGGASWDEKIRFAASPGNSSYINSGNFGLGTTEPGANLDILPTGSGPLVRIAGGATSGYGYLQFGRSPTVTSNWHLGSENDGSFRLWNGNWGAGGMHTIFRSNGHVGMGTTTPRTRLEITNGANTYGPNAAHIQLSGAHGAGASYAGIRFSMLEHTTGWGADIQAQDDTAQYGGALLFRTGGGAATATPTERLRITSSGNIGIGTAVPTEKLSVKGKIRAQEVIVETTGWADYVLSRDYQLTPLSEVEAHIDANGTLPGIPSAKQVDEEGVSVGEMQAKLLAKVEELTLHLIAQEKALNAQRAELQELREANSRLANRSE
ncbi:MAG: hypothetical protein SFV32_13880 [Opitutaceae bacterium]|nr:hypothetical protein [Opitutaceae bacterium]